MNSDEAFPDVDDDPGAIIARATRGAAIFFLSYTALSLFDGEMHSPFLLSLCLGLIACGKGRWIAISAIRRQPAGELPADDGIAGTHAAQ